MRHTAIIIAIIAITMVGGLFGSPVTADAPPIVIVEHDGIIHCDVSVEFVVEGFDCTQPFTTCGPCPDPGLTEKNDASFYVTTSTQSRVTVTLTWTAVSEDAEALYFRLLGNKTCSSFPYHYDECWWPDVRGTSPLTLHLEGVGASNVEIKANVWGAGTCNGTEADWPCTEFVRVIREQPFHLKWVIE